MKIKLGKKFLQRTLELIWKNCSVFPPPPFIYITSLQIVLMKWRRVYLRLVIGLRMAVKECILHNYLFCSQRL